MTTSTDKPLSLLIMKGASFCCTIFNNPDSRITDALPNSEIIASLLGPRTFSPEGITNDHQTISE